MSCSTRRPEWLKLRPLNSTVLSNIRKVTHDLKLHTVCDSARCPNRPECFAQGEEPERIVVAFDKLKLRYVVITSVTRDDLPYVSRPPDPSGKNG